MKNLETDKRVRKTKMAFRQALRKLLSQKDIRNITVKELCELADVNRGTFYAHYTEIHDIIDEMEGEMEATLLHMFDNTKPGTSTRDIISNHLYQAILHVASHQDMCDVIFAKYPEHNFHVRMSSIASRYLADTYIITSNEERILAENMYCFISGGCMGILRKWIQDGMKESPQEVANTALQLINHTLFQ